MKDNAFFAGFHRTTLNKDNVMSLSRKLHGPLSLSAFHSVNILDLTIRPDHISGNPVRGGNDGLAVAIEGNGVTPKQISKTYSSRGRYLDNGGISYAAISATPTKYSPAYPTQPSRQPTRNDKWGPDTRIDPRFRTTVSTAHKLFLSGPLGATLSEVTPPNVRFGTARDTHAIRTCARLHTPVGVAWHPTWQKKTGCANVRSSRTSGN